MVVALMKSVNIIAPMVIVMRKSFMEKSKFHPTRSWKARILSYPAIPSLGIKSTIITANAPRKLHQESICCQFFGIYSSHRKKFIMPIGKYILIARAAITTAITINIGMIKAQKLIFWWLSKSPRRINTSESAKKAKKCQNWFICASTFGEMECLP